MAKICDKCLYAHIHPEQNDAYVCKRYPPTWQFLVIEQTNGGNIISMNQHMGQTAVQRKSAQPSVRAHDTCGEYKRRGTS